MRIHLDDIEEIVSDEEYTDIVLTNGKVLLVEDEVVVIISAEDVTLESE